MFLDLFYELRRLQVPVATGEWMLLMRGLELDLHGSSLDGFYQLARSICVKDVAHYDAFDAAWLKVMRGVDIAALEISADMLAWLEDPKRRRELTPEELALLEALTPAELQDYFRRRLAEQKGRHDRGNRWIGTGGTSPLGTGGTHPTGMAVGGGGGRSAMQVAGERRWTEYRRDLVLDVRQIDLALRLLRDLGREGAADELDLPETIDRTARNAGDLDVVMAPPRRNRIRVILLMDVGGSMDPHAELVSRLFTAASRTGRFRRFRSFYFHNCVYDCVYEDADFRRRLPVADLLATSDRDERLVVVGDAAMHPGELLQASGSLYSLLEQPTPGIEWMRRLAGRFRRTLWLNPEPEMFWGNTTVRILGGLFPMFPLTLDGLHRAVRHLLRGAGAPAAAG